MFLKKIFEFVVLKRARAERAQNLAKEWEWSKLNLKSRGAEQIKI